MTALKFIDDTEGAISGAISCSFAANSSPSPARSSPRCHAMLAEGTWRHAGMRTCLKAVHAYVEKGWRSFGHVGMWSM